jgi:tetratricopeptide (TPR) repeat protein
MNTETPVLSEAFQRLYCEAGVFDAFSAWHPISFRRVLPFQVEDPVVDDAGLIAAEVAHLAQPNAATRLAVLEAFARCRLLSSDDLTNLKLVLDDFEGESSAEFFELMGDLYANAGMFICALRWYREFIAAIESQPQNSDSPIVPDTGSVYASVGYCLYALGLFAEAIAWTKSCIGPVQMADTVCRALINYEAQLLGGWVVAVERAANRARYTASAFDPAQANQLTPRLKLAMSNFAPFQENYLDWVSSETPAPEIQPGGYPFQPERESGDVTRHRMNLLFATAAHADALVARGNLGEAKRLLIEAAMLEPRADFIQERIRG